MLVTAFVNAIISTVLFFAINRFIIDNTYIPLMVRRYTNIVQEHYAAGKSDDTLPDTIKRIEATYGPFLYNSILVATANNIIVYPSDTPSQLLDTDTYSRRFAFHLEDGTVMYLFPSTSFGAYPPIRGFTGYTIGLVITILLCTAVVTAVIGMLLLMLIYRSISQLVQLLPQHNSDKKFVTQLMPSIPLETLVIAQALDERDTEIRQRTNMQRQLIADVAHELRNPLNTINGYVEAMRDGDLVPTHTRLAVVHEEVQALNRLINDMHLLSLAEIHQLPIHAAPTDVCVFAQNVYQIMHEICQTRHITFELSCARPAVEVMMDTGRMTRVLTNLIDNAIRHTRPHGRIMLIISYTDATVSFAVQDSGAGIDSADIPHLFDRFYRGSNPTGEGTGLGLAIAKAIVEAHHGSISIASQINHGTTITVHIPRTPPTD